jgi:hypothetical protein
MLKNISIQAASLAILFLLLHNSTRSISSISNFFQMFGVVDQYFQDLHKTFDTTTEPQTHALYYPSSVPTGHL